MNHLPLLALLFPALLFAQTNWNGTADSAWYTNAKTATSYTITTAEQLAGLAAVVNRGTTFQNRTITLGTNIVLNDTSVQGGWRNWSSGNANLRKWTPIGNAASNFKGKFDGNGKVVTGLYIDSDADLQGLFGVAYEGSITNLGLAGLYVRGRANVGGISGRLNTMPVLSCSVPRESVAGMAITPTVTCSIGSLTNQGWKGEPSWSSPSAGTYDVKATGTCDGIAGLTASCGTLTVCVNCFTDSRDGSAYDTVRIGTQTWMAENLNYNANGSRCYSNLKSNCDTYGRLYDWAAAMGLNLSCNSSACASQVSSKHRGICPSGWHVPSDAEWTTLTDFVGGASTAGTKLKATSGWYTISGYIAGTDDYGFSALPGGGGDSGGSFYSVGNSGYWWSASGFNSDYAYHRYMYYDYENVGRQDYYKSDLFAVRCLKD
ncbi:MAG: fibrobacter succinogenes major paralogous domain-containing protein [Fibromonadales bacterium]|nr:fibrobacter succinogenes major paralogous domain-containing protein [Fibromonadales bacterium]